MQPDNCITFRVQFLCSFVGLSKAELAKCGLPLCCEARARALCNIGHSLVHCRRCLL